jgi:hypothetical protein
LWEALLPEEAKRLPAELAKIDGYLDDERFIGPWRAMFDRRLDHPPPRTLTAGGPTIGPGHEHYNRHRPHRARGIEAIHPAISGTSV